MGRIVLACLIAAGPFSTAWAQQQMDPTTALTLIGACTYREAAMGAQLQQAQREKAATAAWWAAYIGKPASKPK